MKIEKKKKKIALNTSPKIDGFLGIAYDPLFPAAQYFLKL